MTTPSATALQPARAPRIAWLPVALVFIVGTTIGAIAAASAINFSQADGTEVPAAVVPNAELGRLLGNMDAAAARGEARLFLAWRQDLTELIGAAGVAKYEAARGVDAAVASTTEMARLLGNMDAAAARGDVRLFLAFRQDLVGLIGAARVAEYEAVRGVDAPINWVDPTRHLKQRNQPPTFHESDNSGGI